MLFNSPVFLLLFLPVVLTGYLLLQKLGRGRAAMLWLTLCSLFFYGWWNPVYVPLLLLSIGVNFSLARGMASGNRSLLMAGIAFNVGLLGYFKYSNFFIDSLNHVAGTGWHFETVILPLAISFYTFQQITYLVDTHKGLTRPHDLLEYALFVAFFPQLIAGPIVHHAEMLGQFRKPRFDGGAARNVAIGTSIFAIGLFKKAVVADGFAKFANPVFELANNGGAVGSADALVGMFAYAFQLYFDFSGYSDMAVGLGCLFGIRLPVNFFSPFRARNISEFWHMWHATLSRFLRDYVYSPLGGFVCSPRRQRFNLFATMFVGGIWHGAGWTFVVYGLCHGGYAVLHQLWRVRVSGPLELVSRRWYQAAAQLLTFLVVVLTLVVFRADSLSAAGQLFSSLWQLQGSGLSDTLRQATLTSAPVLLAYESGAQLAPLVTVVALLFLALLACWTLPSTSQLFADCQVTLTNPRAGRAPLLPITWQPNVSWAIFTALLLFAAGLNLTEVSEFLYFQF
jgi:D-alanyl-lipoteichoic acid acyltransferase DltB (MBOAT superfamily)